MSDNWIIAAAVLIVLAILLLFIFVGKREKKAIRSINYFLEKKDVEEESLVEEWQRNNGLVDDTYITLLKIFHLDKPIPVNSITVNNDTEEVTVCFNVPNTENSLTVTMDFDEIEFQIGGLNGKTKQVWLFFDLDLWSESPIYDEDTQIPINHIDWRFVVENITSLKLYVSKEQYNTLFPEVTI